MSCVSRLHSLVTGDASGDNEVFISSLLCGTSSLSYHGSAVILSFQKTMTEENWADHIQVSVNFTGLFSWRLFEDVLAYPALDVVVLLSQFCTFSTL